MHSPSVPKADGHRKVQEDFFQTPRPSILPVLKYIPSDVKIIWEPTHGAGAITSVLEEHGYNVIKSDLYVKTNDGCKEMDFLNSEPEEAYDMIVFNPPFCSKLAFMERAPELGKPFLFIAPLHVVESAERWRLFREHELSIVNLSRRTKYTGHNPTFHSVWVTNDGQSRMYYEEVTESEEGFVKTLVKGIIARVVRTGTVTVKRKKTASDKTKLNAYHVFMKETRPILVAMGVSNNDMFASLASKWKDVSSTDRARFKQLAVEQNTKADIQISST